MVLRPLVPLSVFALAGCSMLDRGGDAGSGAADPFTLVAARAAAAPALDGNPNDAAWMQARPLTIKLEDGANFKGGETTATLKATYAGDSVYFLIQYADPTQSIRRGPFQKQADGSWKKLADPNDKGGDANVYYEDKWSLIWNTSSAIKGFDEKGCGVLCHLGQGKPFGNKYTASEGEIADMWHLKGSRNGVLGFVDDQYVDATRYENGKNPNAGRKGDPGGPDYKAFGLSGGRPELMNRDGRAANGGGSYWIRDGEQVAFDDSRFKAGDEVASYIVFPLKGDRGDLRVAYRWENGQYTYEVARKLVTGSNFDVQFSDLAKAYTFGFAAFDDAQVRHAVNYETLKLVFRR